MGNRAGHPKICSQGALRTVVLHSERGVALSEGHIQVQAPCPWLPVPPFM